MKIHVQGWHTSNIVAHTKQPNGNRSVLCHSEGSGDTLGHGGQRSELGDCVQDVWEQARNVRNGLDKLGGAK